MIASPRKNPGRRAALVLLVLAGAGGVAPFDSGLRALAQGKQDQAIDWAGHPENTWVRQSPRDGKPIPKFGWEGSGAYDPARRRWIHQGGHDGNPQGFALFTFDLASAAWEQVFPNTSPPGSCCVDGANVFDAAHGRFVRFPGAALGHGWQWSRKVKMKGSPVWLYDPETRTWTGMRPPPYQEPEKYSKSVLGALNAGATYDPNHQVSLSFGGQASGGGMNNLFVYDAYSNTLERLQGKGPPEARDGHGIAYDAGNDRLVLFGSQYGNDEKTWVYRYETNAWEGLDLDPHPPGKKGKTYSTIPRMAYDSANGVTLCLTWDDATGQHQTWILDLAQRKWTAMKPPKEPETSSSRSRNLSYLPEQNVFLLELVAKDRGPEIWSYRYKKAASGPTAPPSGLEIATGAGKATLAWTAAPGGGEVEIHRARADKAWEAKYEKIASTKETRFTDEGLEAGKTYFYRVAVPGGRAVARTQPRVLLKPVVSVLAADRVEVAWNAHPAKDLAGYNVYRGTVSVATVKKGSPGAWKDNDPEYAEPQVVSVRDITGLVKLNAAPLEATSYTDSAIDLAKKGPESGDYKHAVHAYVVRAVNRLGTESGPSPYALTLPSEPENVLLREKEGSAEIKWDASREKGIAGYLVYEVSDQKVARITPEPVKGTSFVHPAGNATRRYSIVAVDALGQEGQPSSPAWCHKSYKGFFAGEWHQ